MAGDRRRQYPFDAVTRDRIRDGYGHDVHTNDARLARRFKRIRQSCDWNNTVFRDQG